MTGYQAYGAFILVMTFTGCGLLSYRVFGAEFTRLMGLALIAVTVVSTLLGIGMALLFGELP